MTQRVFIDFERKQTKRKRERRQTRMIEKHLQIKTKDHQVKKHPLKQP